MPVAFIVNVLSNLCNNVNHSDLTVTLLEPLSWIPMFLSSSHCLDEPEISSELYMAGRVTFGLRTSTKHIAI